MTAPVFGLQFIQQDDQAQPVLGANLDVVGIIGPCSTADANTFPLNTPVLVISNDTATLAKLYPNGDATQESDGFIVDAINGINDQLADFQVAAQIVIVRTAYGTAEDFNLQLQQTIANIMGSSVAGTGVHAFLSAPNTLYCTPRLIMAPGYTGQMANSLDTLVVDTVGQGYIPGGVYSVTFANGNGETNGAQLVLPTAHATADSNGNIDNAQIFIDSWGAWATVAPTATLPAPDGPAINAVAAVGDIIFTATPAIGSTITLDGTVSTFIAHGGTPSGAQIALGTDLGSTLTALTTYLNASADSQISKNTYNQNNLTLSFTSKTPGAAGNSFTVATDVSGASAYPHMTGGSDAVSPTRGTLTATIALGANPVCAELSGGVLDSLVGHAVVESAGTSYIADLNWRDTLDSQRLIGLSGGVKVIQPISGDVVVMPLAPRVIGQIIARDFATGYPFHSAANQAINGIVGPARSIAFNLTDGAVEGQELLAANLGIIARGLIGVENAISAGGFVFIGTDNLGSDSLWQFYNVTRGRDYITLSLMPALRTYLGKSNIDAQTVKNVMDTIKDFLSGLQALQQILGFKTSFQGSLNSASEIRLGHLTVSFAAEEPPVLRRITTMSARYKPAIDALVAQLEEQLS